MQTAGISACKGSPAEMCVFCPVRLCEKISQASVACICHIEWITSFCGGYCGLYVGIFTSLIFYYMGNKLLWYKALLYLHEALYWCFYFW